MVEIILKQDVANLGLKDDIVEVKNGYALNYLIPQGFAIMATPSAKKVHAENLRQRAHKEARIRQDAEALAARLAELQLRIAAKASENGKIFGSVGNIQVAEALAAAGVEVDRKDIELEPIKELGSYEATVKCYRDIKGTVRFEVVAEEE
ncbi:50S ribosomal protein L9 [Muribaculum sp. An289]|uniref:50S ribosomal protein L9 n=1 Tax=unclassified Muribaculum TaxID=2622126 RepID=UPI000B372E7D|nr:MULTISPECIES: 50S ribosomal protein L9 [unclassified Muribaculum]OUO36924.1 50S ribosomal protein L9 [Muribaculum sp. An289]OUO42973.1 50S ribosomal protein L9 [Muribaculum sp. An287]